MTIHTLARGSGRGSSGIVFFSRRQSNNWSAALQRACERKERQGRSCCRAQQLQSDWGRALYTRPHDDQAGAQQLGETCSARVCYVLSSSRISDSTVQQHVAIRWGQHLRLIDTGPLRAA